ncbi:MAG: hypothetical protein J6N52_07980 [Clostridia bacterium]|nr:hypothetical protein [Clostridia bacterium]
MKKIISICIAAAALFTNIAYAASVSDVTSIPAGASRDEVHALLGAPHSSSVSGKKEIYILPNGQNAVFRYFDNMLDMGFILV